MKHRLTIFTVVAVALAAFTSEPKIEKETPPAKLSNQVVLDWNRHAYKALGGPENQHSLLAACTYAMMHAAIHDAVNAAEPHFQPYAYHKKHLGADPEVAAATAAHRVLSVSFPAAGGWLDSTLPAFISQKPASPAIQKGIEAGIGAANELLGFSHNAQASLNPIGQPAPYVKAGDYKNVPPFDFIFAPFWQDAKLFSLKSKDQFRCPPPPSLGSKTYTAAFNEVKNFGALKSSSRSVDQTFFAGYWYEFSERGWNRIATVVADQKKTDLFVTARLFALLNFAMADAYTAGWDSKLHYNFWRPFTAIREASNDGNKKTAASNNWEPEQPTPPIQDYPSTHSALGNAAAMVLAHVFGDQTEFTMRSPSASPINAPRSFKSFSQAAAENAESRVMAGIHFRFSCDAGLELGKKIGRWTVENYLKPLH